MAHVKSLLKLTIIWEFGRHLWNFP
jgi:hypothetical protein